MRRVTGTTRRVTGTTRRVTLCPRLAAVVAAASPGTTIRWLSTAHCTPCTISVPHSAAAYAI
eukprot:342483-Rhodomonas_salina.2